MNTLPPINPQHMRLLFRRLIWCAAFLWLAWCLWFSVYYFTTGYNTLKSWFLSLNGCIYKQESWATDFFTPAVKDVGNKFALAAGIISSLGILHLIAIRKRFQQLIPYPSGVINENAPKWPWYLLIIALGFGLWYWGNGLVAAANDEIFSAVNCAEAHPFQTIAYYMLPNNHMYFNLLNGTIFRPMSDHVLSGRILSMIAYCSMLCIAFSWFSSISPNRLLATLAVVPIALQFTIWGFSFQARGYEWQLLCCWIAFITIFKYEQTRNIDLLRLNTFFCVLGFILVPTFLYYYLAQLSFMLLAQLFSRSIDFKFWQFQLFWACSVFLCYTPGFCFSGYNAFTGNMYVKEAFPDVHTFWPVFTEVTTYLFNFCFSCIIREGHPINYILLCLPLLLFFLPQRKHKMLGTFYLLMWAVYTVVVLYMKRVPFNRNMILHYSLTLAAVIYTLYTIVDLVCIKLKSRLLNIFIKVVFYMLPISLFSYHLFSEDCKNVSLNLYFYDLNILHDTTVSEISTLPPGSSIGCSNEGFYWYYFGKKLKYKTTLCPVGNEDFYAKRATEPLPAGYENNYSLVKKGFSDYEIYKRK